MFSIIARPNRLIRSVAEFSFPDFIMIQKHSLMAAACAAALVLSGCASDGNLYRSDVYTAGQVNQRQEVQTVEILSVTPAQIAVSNSENRESAQATGAILGAIAGAFIGNHGNHSTSSRVMGGLAGGALGGLAGDAVGGRSGTNYVDGVQLVYRTSGGKVYQSAQVGRLCEYKLGTAIVVASRNNETRIQPNNPYGCQNTNR